MQIYIGTYSHIPLYIHFSWFLALSAFWVVFGWLNAVFYTCASAFIVLHEYGHCFAARYWGYKTFDVIIYPFGGIATINIQETKPKEEFFIAIAGPAVNFLLMFIFSFFSLLYYDYKTTSSLLLLAASANMVLGIFNLLPLFPMDGGRVFRSILQGITKNHLLSTFWAVRVSQILCTLGFFLCLFLWKNIPACVIFAIIFVSAQNELITARTASVIANIKLKVSFILQREDVAEMNDLEFIQTLESLNEEQREECLQVCELVPLLRELKSLEESPR